MSTRRIVETDFGLSVDYSESLWQAAQLLKIPGFTAERAFSDPGLGADLLNFPGVLACRNSSVLGVTGCSLEPDGTMSVTLPVLTPLVAWKEQPSVVRVMFDGIRRIAAEQHAHGIHCLVPDGPPADLAELAADASLRTAQLMEYSGLSTVATVIRLERCVPSETIRPPVESSAEMSGSWADAAEGVTVMPVDQTFLEDSHCESFQMFLNQILQQSLDLPSAIRPTGRQLLSIWCHRRSLLFCLGERWNPLGVAAVSGPTITLEYVGVRPDCRKQGIGSRLLSAIEQYFRANQTSEPPGPLTLTAYSDAANVPALALYRKCGYEEKEQFRLMYVPVQTSR